MTKSERRMEVALMRAANQKAGMKLKPKWYQENFRNHWEKIIEKMKRIKFVSYGCHQLSISNLLLEVGPTPAGLTAV